MFLDLDGTLLALRDDPAVVRADAALMALLHDCTARVTGALAIVSGRPLADLDACFAPARFAAAGLHGLQRRDTLGVVHDAPVDARPLRRQLPDLATAMENLPMTVLEDKGPSVALHWRQAPQFAPRLRELARQTLADAGAGYRLLEGDCVIEVLPRVADKGDAVRAFMHEAPFRGRTPVFIGDDLTDLPGFAVARELGGHGIAVGPRVTSDYWLPDVPAVRNWLAVRER